MKDEITTYFEGNYLAFYERYLPDIKKEKGNQYKTKCPFHEDSNPSFSININTGQFNCFGCDKQGDMFAFYAEKDGLDIKLDFPKILTGIADDFGIEEKYNEMNIVKTYDYISAQGQLLYQVARMEPKTFRVRHPDGNGDWVWGIEKIERVLYCLPSVIEASEVLICEGEKDADTLAALGLTATTNFGGGGNWLPEYNQFLKDKDIVLFPDNDEKGQKHMTDIAASLNGQAKSIKLINLPGLEDGEDVSDFIGKFDDETEAAIKLCTIIEGTTPYKPPEHLSEEDILQGLNTNEDGDAELFIKLNYGRFVYDHSTDKYYRFGKHYWIEDTSNKAMACISKVIEEYSCLVEAETKKRLKAERSGKTEQAKKHKDTTEAIYKRINSLHSIYRKADVLKLAGIDWTDQGRPSLAITGEEWDSKTMVLPCANGVLDLRLDADPILQKGNSEDYIKTVSPIKWKGINEPADRWDEFLLEIFDNDEELVNFIQQLFGYAITGKVTEHILLILFGEGRNGKGTLLELLNYILGRLMGSIGVETLLAQKYPKQPGTASPHLMALKGKRIVWTSEASEGRRFDTGTVKLLTGGDTISARDVWGKRVVNFSPTHTLFFLTNDKPYLPAEDYAIWQRIRLIPFNKKFIDDPKENNECQRDPNLLEKLKHEAPGILAWLVRGCHEWQKSGYLTPPKQVKESTVEYQKEVDTVGHFLDACCEVDTKDQEMKGRAGIFYESYLEWCKKSGYRYVNIRAFNRNMKKKFRQEKDRDGLYYEGVKLLMPGVETN